jgi:hypothetical protein
MAYYIERVHHITKKPVYLKTDSSWTSKYDLRVRYDTIEEANVVRDKSKFGTVKSE